MEESDNSIFSEEYLNKNLDTYHELFIKTTEGLCKTVISISGGTIVLIISSLYKGIFKTVPIFYIKLCIIFFLIAIILYIIALKFLNEYFGRKRKLFADSINNLNGNKSIDISKKDLEEDKESGPEYRLSILAEVSFSFGVACFIFLIVNYNF